mgnify:CR=1 FL=1
MKRIVAVVVVSLVLGGLAVVASPPQAPPADAPVTIAVDTSIPTGAMHPFWAWFGHDEPNYTYTPNGHKLLSPSLSRASRSASGS